MAVKLRRFGDAKMSIAKRIAFGAVATWISRATSILLGLLLMPVLFRHLQREELGIWLLLGQSWATLGILDLGFGATLGRRIAFAVGKNGCDPGAPLSADSVRDLADLIETGRRAYRGLAILAFVVSFCVGVYSLRHLHLSTVAFHGVWLAWGVLCLSQAVGVWASVWTCLLQGVGYVGWDALVAAFTGAITLSAQIGVALCGGGLIGLAVVAAGGALTQRLLILRLARGKRPELFAIRGQWQTRLLKGMMPLALKAWVTCLGGVLVLNSDQFFIVGLRGASQIPEYRAAYIIFLNLNMLAVTFASSSSVFIAQLWQAGAIEKVHRIVTYNLRLGLIIMATGGASVLALGQHLFNIWIGHGNYIGTATASVFFLLLMLETQSFIIATCSRATEDEAFAICTGVAAALKVLLSLLLGAKFGLIGIALGTLGAQLVTNHWFMCYRGLRRLRLSLRDHVQHVLVPVGLVFALTVLAIRILVMLTSAGPDWIVVGAGALVSACLLAGSIWLFVLDHSQRQLAATFPLRVLRATLG